MARRPGNPPASPSSATLRPPKRADSRTHGVPANRALGAGIAARETAILHPVGSDGPIQPTKAPHTEFLTLPRFHVRDPGQRQLPRQPSLVRAERPLRSAPRLRRVRRDHLDPELRDQRPPELGRIRLVHLPARLRRRPVVRGAVRVQRAEQPLRLHRLADPEEAAPGPLPGAQEHRVVLVRRVVHGHHQVPRLARHPRVRARVLVHQHPGHRRRLAPLPVPAAAPFPLHRAVLLKLVLHPAVAPRPARVPVEAIKVPHLPAVVVRLVPVHQRHHLVRVAARCEARDTRRSRSPSIPSSP